MTEASHQSVPSQVAPARVYLEDPKKLSKCLLWKMLEDYYSSTGIDAWEEVPYYPTSNSFIGHAYADGVMAFLRDYAPHLDRNEPVYILEMATGSGTFSFFHMKALAMRKALMPSLADVDIRYVMTDFTDNNVKSWEANPGLKPFVESGFLDFGVFRPEDDTEITLRRTGKVLNAGTVKNPVFAIANYFFDSIRQDFYQIREKQIFSCDVQFYREPASEEEAQRKVRFDEMRPECKYQPLSGAAYQDPAIEKVLQSYTETVPNGCVLFPLGPLKVIQNLQTLANGNVVLLSSDKGFHDLSYFEGFWDVPYTPHTGIFSFMVNYHALSTYFKQQGGQVFLANENYTLTTMMGVLLKDKPDFVLENVDYTWKTHLGRHNPIKNFYSLKDMLNQFVPRDEVDRKMLFKIAFGPVQLSDFDPYIFSQCAPYMQIALNERGKGAFEDDLRGLLNTVHNNLYNGAVGYYEAYHWLRTLYYELDDYDTCLAINEEMFSKFGPERNIYYYQGAIHEIRKSYRQALNCYKQSVEQDSTYELALSGLQRVKAVLGES